MTKIIVEIEYTDHEDKDWLNADNIAACLRAGCSDGTIFKVKKLIGKAENKDNEEIKYDSKELCKEYNNEDKQEHGTGTITPNFMCGSMSNKLVNH